MYQKAFESVVNLFVNRFTPYKLIQAVFEEIKIQELFVTHVFEKDFIFEYGFLIISSGRKIFNGNFSFICELSIIINNTENVHLKKLMELSKKQLICRWKLERVLQKFCQAY